MEIPWGDQLTDKEADTVRLLGCTMGPTGLSPQNRHHVQLVKDFIRHTQADILGAYEVNTQWNNLGKHQHPSELFRTDRALRCQTSHNKHDKGCRGGTFQWGGTMLTAHDTITTQLTQKGQDPKGLGRWSWMLLQGKHGARTRIISAYCPNRSNAGRLQAVYSQQQRWLRYKHNIQTCPRQVFIDDLIHFISACRHKNERIVLFIDANDNILQSPLSTALAELDIREGITGHHPTLRPPATHSRGSRTIDGIFLSPELQPTKAGFLALSPHLGDHRPTYVDIPWKTLLGDDVLHIERPPARRLTTRDPKVVKKYNRLLEDFLLKHHIPSRLETLKQATDDQTTYSPLQLQQLEQLDTEITEGMRYAEKRCRKLAMGGLDFSPSLIKAWDTKQLC